MSETISGSSTRNRMSSLAAWLLHLLHDRHAVVQRQALTKLLPKMQQEYSRTFHAHRLGSLSGVTTPRLSIAVRCNLVGCSTNGQRIDLKSPLALPTPSPCGYQRWVRKACVRRCPPCLCHSTSLSTSFHTFELPSRLNLLQSSLSTPKVPQIYFVHIKARLVPSQLPYLTHFSG